MRRFLSALGAAALAVLLLLGVAVGIDRYEGRVLAAESKAFVDRAVPAIARHWNVDELLARATPSLRRAAGPEAVTHAFAGLSTLGPLLLYEGAEGRAALSYTRGTERVAVAAYLARARFRHGAALFQIVLVRRGGHWMIDEFQVRPLPEPAGAGRELRI